MLEIQAAQTCVLSFTPPLCVAQQWVAGQRSSREVITTTTMTNVEPNCHEHYQAMCCATLPAPARVFYVPEPRKSTQFPSPLEKIATAAPATVVIHLGEMSVAVRSCAPRALLPSLCGRAACKLRVHNCPSF